MYKKNLVYLRKRQGITLKTIGDILNISPSCYGHYEKEDNIIPLKHLIKVCDYFNVSLDYIFEFTDKRNYSNYKKGVNTKAVGQRLKEFRKNNNISQEALAIYNDNNRTNISGYEIGTQLISTSFLYQICKKYKISADYLLGKIDNPKQF